MSHSPFFKDDCTTLANQEVVKYDYSSFTKFTHKWLQVEIPVLAEHQFTKLQDDNPMDNFLNSPLMMTLLGLVFEETGHVPVNRTQLFQGGIKLLLKQWDKKYQFAGDKYYRKLSPQQKEDLLSHIAYKTFTSGDYFFKQKDLENYIADYFCNSNSLHDNLEIFHLNSKAVLKSIQDQHGIFVEWSKGVYSFAILSVHEYLAAKQISNSVEVHNLENLIQNLVSQITESRWHEVFSMTAGLLQNADYLVLLMKHEIDDILSSDEEIQQLLFWINEKSATSKKHKPAAIRAYYLECILNLHINLDDSINNNIDYDFEEDSFLRLLQNCQLNFQQQEVLHQYYEANQLLVDCLDNAHYITPSLREELEATLLVPSLITKINSIVPRKQNWLS